MSKMIIGKINEINTNGDGTKNIIIERYGVHKKAKHFVKMSKTNGQWEFYIVGINGVPIADSFRAYDNKAQCRNVGKKFAEMYDMEWRE